MEFTNHSKGPRGVNLKGGATRWIEPGETAEIDKADIVGELPDFGQPSDAVASDTIEDLKRQLAEAKARIVELEAAAGAAAPDDIATAVATLDPASDDHWTKGGLPSVEAVEALVGKPVTRAQIAEAAPDAKRPTA